MTDQPPAEPATGRSPRLGKGLRMASVVLASALAAGATLLLLEALGGELDVPLRGTADSMDLLVRTSMTVGAIVAGLALLLAALLLPRVTRAILVTRVVGVVVLAVSLVPVVQAWGDLAFPFGLVVLHVVVAIVVLLGLDWAMDDAATIDA